jgi:hypothetical protein
MGVRVDVAAPGGNHSRLPIRHSGPSAALQALRMNFGIAEGRNLGQLLRQALLLAD